MNRFLLIFFRSIRKNPRLFLIVISSFSIGLVAVQFINLYVFKEFNTDKFHREHTNIYRILKTSVSAPIRYSEFPHPTGNLLQNNHSQIEYFCRYTTNDLYTVTIGEKKFKNQEISFTDPSFFEMFNFKVGTGDFTQIFKEPNTVVIDPKTAQRYFNSTDVLGQTFETEIAGIRKIQLLKVVGVLETFPEESTIKPRIILNIEDLVDGNANNYFQSPHSQLFLLIPNLQNVNQLSVQLAETFYNKLNEFRSKKAQIDIHQLQLQNLADIYLDSAKVRDNFVKGDRFLLWILICIGSLLLIITLINYIILTLGLGLKNVKQNQINIFLGGSSEWLRSKFVVESVTYTIIGFILSILLLPLVHQEISSTTDFQYSLFTKSDFKIILYTFLVIILLGVLCGYIQYLFFRSTEIGKAKLIGSSTNPVFFKYLAPFQLLVFMTTLISLLFIGKQIRFIKDQELGFDPENIISVNINDYNNKKLFKEEFENHSYINHLAYGHFMLKQTPYLNEVTIDESQKVVRSQCIFGDNNYLDTYKIKLISGSNINGDKLPPIDEYFRYQQENILDILINEEFVRKSGLEDPLGTILSINHNGVSKGRITGVFENVKNLPIYEPITPIVIGYGLSVGPEIIVSLKEGKTEEFKADVVNFIKKIGKEEYFGYSTFEFDFGRWYKKEISLVQLLEVFSFITLFILVLGLVGISLFITERKIKEIGIRKVNGAKISEILTLLNKDFVKWVVIAFVIATPIGWYAMDQWLQNFAYKTELSWWVFALAGLLALGVALLTVSWQSWKAATRNPVEALRYE